VFLAGRKSPPARCGGPGNWFLHVLDIKKKQAICQAISTRTRLPAGQHRKFDLRIKSTPLEGKMRSRINAVVIFAAAFIAFTAVSSAKGVQTSRHHLPTTVLTASPGPMCFQDSGCGYTGGVSARGANFPENILLADSPGPMCFPHSGCGYKDDVSASGRRFPARVLLADSPGPMCFPSTGCGYKTVVSAIETVQRVSIEGRAKASPLFG
jgi:hypothetical protein